MAAYPLLAVAVLLMAAVVRALLWHTAIDDEMTIRLAIPPLQPNLVESRAPSPLAHAYATIGHVSGHACTASNAGLARLIRQTERSAMRRWHSTFLLMQAMATEPWQPGTPRQPLTAQAASIGSLTGACTGTSACIHCTHQGKWSMYSQARPLHMHRCSARRRPALPPPRRIDSTTTKYDASARLRACSLSIASAHHGEHGAVIASHLLHRNHPRAASARGAAQRQAEHGHQRMHAMLVARPI